MGKRRGLIDFGRAWLSWFRNGGGFDRRSGGRARSFLRGKEEIDIHDY